MPPRSNKTATLLSILFIVFGISAPVGVVSSSSDSTQPGGPDFCAIDAYVEAEMEADRVPGAALAIVRGDRIVHARGFGVGEPEGRRITPRTAFILGSMSKSFTALAVMQLHEAGKIDLDAPVVQYLPWFHVASPEASKIITIRHLLHHTSGLTRKAPYAKEGDSTLEDHVRTLRTATLTHPPGTRHQYSSTNYQVLGLLVETLSGQPFGEYVRQHIFTPLEMNHSFVSKADATQAGMSSGHRLWFGYPMAADLRHETDRLPTAALISCAEDMAHYLIAHLNVGTFRGTAIISPQGMSELHRPAAKGEGFDYAMGWRVGPIHGVPALHHGGIVPHFRGKLVILPKERWGVVVLTNVSSMLGGPTSHRLANGVAALLAGRTPDRPRFSLGTLYLLITLGVILLSVGQIKENVLIGRWYNQLVEQISKGRTSIRKMIPGLAGGIVWPLFILACLPRIIGFSWAVMIRQMPDVGYWLIISALLGMATGLVKIGLVLKTRKMQHEQHEQKH